MIRSVLSDTQWERIAPLLPGKPGDPGRSGDNNRGFLEAVLWIARTGSPWRDLHPDFGLWNSIFRRFRRWATKGVFESLFKELSGAVIPPKTNRKGALECDFEMYKW